MPPYNQIAPYLFQGSVPLEGPSLARKGFRVLVLCADEFQPPADLFPGLEVIYAPNDDSGAPFTALQQAIAVMASHRVANYMHQHQTVLVTCMQGRNRSGLVSALALHHITGWAGKDCVRRVQRKRPDSLANQDFVRYLEKLPARRLAG